MARRCWSGSRPRRSEVFIDRRNARKGAWHKEYPGRHAAPVRGIDGRVSLRILFDRSVIEVFVNGGERVLTDRVYPTAALRSRRPDWRPSTAGVTVEALDHRPGDAVVDSTPSHFLDPEEPMTNRRDVLRAAAACRSGCSPAGERPPRRRSPPAVHDLDQHRDHVQHRARQPADAAGGPHPCRRREGVQGLQLLECHARRTQGDGQGAAGHRPEVRQPGRHRQCGRHHRLHQARRAGRAC